MKTLEYPLKGYPFTYQEAETHTPAEKSEFIELLVTAAANAELLHKMVQYVYFDFMVLVEKTPNKALTDRLEHSARILENVAFQLSELTTDAKKSYSSFENSVAGKKNIGVGKQ